MRTLLRLRLSMRLSMLQPCLIPQGAVQRAQISRRSDAKKAKRPIAP